MRDAFIGFRATVELKERLQSMADFEDRTLSQMATILLTEAMDVRDEAVRDKFDKFADSIKKEFDRDDL